MRVVLVIFTLIGVAAIALVVLIGAGLRQLSSLDHPTTNAVVATSEPSDAPDESDEAPATQPDASQQAVVDRSVFLSAADAKLSGPRIALMGPDNSVLKTGDGQPPPPPPEDREFGRGFFREGRGGRHRRVPPPPFISRWATADDVVEWTFQSPGEGTYTVSFVYSGPPTRDASKTGGPLVVSIGAQQIIVSPKPTANGSSFEMADVGELHLQAGQVRLAVQPQGKLAYDTSIRLRSVRLFPSQ